MRKQLSILAVGLALVLLVLSGAGALRAQAQSRDALTGVVTSAEEGRMQGVIVSAKAPGSTITVSVVTDDQGRYQFPLSKLSTGPYNLTIRAAGYQLAQSTSAAIGIGTATADLKLVKATDLSAQLSDAEWIASMPGTNEQKFLLGDCNACHSLQRIVRSKFTADGWMPVLTRMMGTYVYNSSPLAQQKRLQPRQVPPASIRPLAEYLATVNLSRGTTWAYPLKTLPRPKGRATHVIYTEYDLPRPASLPHDAVVGAGGTVWYTDFAWPYIGSIDPKSGAVKEYPIPILKAYQTKGSNDLELDSAGNLWIGMLQQSGIARFDPKTKTFKTWALSPNRDSSSIAMVTPPKTPGTTGRIWTNDEGLQGVHRLDLATNKWEDFGPFNDPQGHHLAPYGIFTDSKGNGYVLDYNQDAGHYIGKVDAKTGALSMLPTPTIQARLRRGRVDNEDRFWFAEYGGNKIGRFDIATSTFTEWPMPTPFSWPYDVVRANNGEVWAGSMWTDFVSRLDPKTGDFVQYLLPHDTNIRRVFVDNTTNPVTFWTANMLRASVVKLEPAD